MPSKLYDNKFVLMRISNISFLICSQTVTPNPIREGMKLEAVDKKNNCLTCVATVPDTLGDKLLVHFDGWEDIYDYWCDSTSPYIHPVGWCQTNGVSLSPPFGEEFFVFPYLTNRQKCCVLHFVPVSIQLISKLDIFIVIDWGGGAVLE